MKHYRITLAIERPDGEQPWWFSTTYYSPKTATKLFYNFKRLLEGMTKKENLARQKLYEDNIRRIMTNDQFTKFKAENKLGAEEFKRRLKPEV